MKDYINYKESNRSKLHFFIKEGSDNKDDYILFTDNICIKQGDNRQTINYDDITKIRISICSRVFNPSTATTNPISIFTKRAKGGLHMVSNKGSHMIYSLDMDIVTNGSEMLLESYSLNTIKEILSVFDKDRIEDPIGIIELVNEKESTELQKYLDKNFSILSKEHNLDNPRGIVTNDMHLD